MTTVTISLPESLKQFVDAQVASKGYGNVSEYFRSLLREAQQKEADARLEAFLLEGLASESIPLDEEFWQRFKAKTANIRRKYASRARKKLP
jgi:antitoxin ParD1/3/4